MGCASTKPFVQDLDSIAAPQNQTEEQLRAEIEAAATAAARPLPRGSTWHEHGGEELEPLLPYTTLVDAGWLLKLLLGEVMPERKGVLPAWQDVPSSARVSLHDLRASTMDDSLPVAVLSYGWSGKGHPDATGAQLRRLVPVLRTMVESCTKGVSEHDSGRPKKWGIVIDFLALPQRGYTAGYSAEYDDRTPYEQLRFSKALSGINVWYAAPLVTTLILDLPMPEGADNTTPLERRGWCVFERALSSITKKSSCCLALSCLPPGDAAMESWLNLTITCRVSRKPLVSPEAFEHEMRSGLRREAAAAGTGIRFTNGKDATAVCIPQYFEAFLRLMGAARFLMFNGCGWGDAEATRLADALIWAHQHGATSPASMLMLNRNKLTDASMPQLIRAIEAGAMPNIKDLHLSDNAITDRGAETLAAAVRKGTAANLKTIVIGDNELTEAGKVALRAACASRGVEANSSAYKAL